MPCTIRELNNSPWTRIPSYERPTYVGAPFTTNSRPSIPTTVCRAVRCGCGTDASPRTTTKQRFRMSVDLAFLLQSLCHRQKPVDVVRGVEERRRDADLCGVLADADLGFRLGEVTHDRVLRLAHAEGDDRRAVAFRRRHIETERAEPAPQPVGELHRVRLDAVDADALEILESRTQLIHRPERERGVVEAPGGLV